MRSRLTSTAIVLLTVAPFTLAEDWPAWRGPRGDGTSAETGLPVRWSAKENITWKTPIPGIGHSSPVVQGNRIFLTTCLLDTQERVLLCLDRKSGNILWQQVCLNTPLEKKHKLNSFASSTPATDGEFVWTTFLDTNDPLAPTIQVFCYTADGKKVWQKSPGKFFSRHGFCSSPTLYKDLVIVNGDQDALAYIVALDKKTGEEKWRADRPNRTRSYCAPLLVDAGGKTQLVLSGSKCVASYDPSNGKQHWLIDGPTEQYVASLVYGEGLLFLTTGFPEYHNMAIRPDGTGNVTNSHIEWHEKKVPARKASYVPSPIAADRFFYVVSDVGYLNCFDAKTGERLYMEPLGRHHSASPVRVGNLLYFPDDDGITHVLKVGSTFEVVARNALGDECYASPALSAGQIFLRTQRYLWCIEDKK